MEGGGYGSTLLDYTHHVYILRRYKIEYIIYTVLLSKRDVGYSCRMDGESNRIWMRTRQLLNF